jgi:hypothetical protein
MRNNMAVKSFKTVFWRALHNSISVAQIKLMSQDVCNKYGSRDWFHTVFSEDSVGTEAVALSYT